MAGVQDKGHEGTRPLESRVRAHELVEYPVRHGRVMDSGVI